MNPSRSQVEFISTYPVWFRSPGVVLIYIIVLHPSTQSLINI